MAQVVFYKKGKLYVWFQSIFALQPIDSRAKYSVEDPDPEGLIEYGSG